MRNYSQDVRTLATLGGNKNLLFSGGKLKYIYS